MSSSAIVTTPFSSARKIRLREMKDRTVVILGAGPAGTMAASILADAGIDTLILEKSKFPRFSIGESLLPRCLDSLEKGGFLPAIQKANFLTKTGARFYSEDKLCEFDFSVQHTTGWDHAWHVKRGDFDKILADEVEKKGVEIVYGATVTNVELEDETKPTIYYTSNSGAEHQVKAEQIIDASGYGKVLSRLFGLEKPIDGIARQAVFGHVVDQKPQGDWKNKINVICHETETWSWEIAFSDGSTSIGVVSPEHESLESADDELKRWIDRIGEHHNRYKDYNQTFTAKRIRAYGSKTRDFFGNRWVLAGNAFGFIDPIFSSGVTMALVSGEMAGELIAKQVKGQKVDWNKEYLTPIQSGLDVFKSFVDWWYDGTLQKIFFAEKPDELIKNQICSILAGYVWDDTNSVLQKYKRTIPTLAHILSS